MNKIAVTAIAFTVGAVAGIVSNHFATKQRNQDSKESQYQAGREMGRNDALEDAEAVTEAYNRLHPKTNSSKNK